ncbi:hypothetical protein D9756_011322 [Leucocoprinus leucothites]|uniref:Metallothionein n=1 Tax=Leucocoprinus leucothites TaxID=201217 RepID=A0A8H5FPS2_9AGAR|nr:hypothetical protein D9756_011322 [Leucoagaricus leucothites]
MVVEIPQHAPLGPKEEAILLAIYDPQCPTINDYFHHITNVLVDYHCGNANCGCGDNCKCEAGNCKCGAK